MRVDSQSYGGWKRSGVGKEGLVKSMVKKINKNLNLN
jgi:acyl-CoA reductase-like NAD-dependent aldehyde dehydrogenase